MRLDSAGLVRFKEFLAHFVGALAIIVFFMEMEGCLETMSEEWYRGGRLRSGELRHDFRDWCQTLDWIVQNLFKAAPLIEGHEGAQERVSNPGLTFVRKLCLALEAEDSLETPLIASQLYEIAENAGIEVPGLRVPDDDKAKRAIGSIMVKVFSKRNTVELDGFRVLREESIRDREDPSAGGSYRVKAISLQSFS